MELRVLTDTRYPNLDVARKVLAAAGGEEIVEFSNGGESGRLRYSHGDGTRHPVHIAIPLGWLSDPEKAGQIEEAARHFSIRVRFASKHQPFSEGFGVAPPAPRSKPIAGSEDEFLSAEDRSQ